MKISTWRTNWRTALPGWFATLGLIASLCLPARSAPPNLLTNPGFEQGQDGWNGEWDASCFVEREQAYRGAACLRMVCTAPQLRLTQRIEAVEPGANYVLGGWSKATWRASTLYMVSFYRGSREHIRLVSGGFLRGGASWQESRFVFTTPPDAAWVHVQCVIKDPGTAWFDGVYLRRAPGGASPNLLPNSSFECATNPDTPDWWGRDLNVPPFGADAWTLDRSTAYHGTNSVRIGLVGKFVRCKAEVIKGRRTVFSAYLKSGAPGTRASLRFSGFDRETREKTFDVTTEWQRHWVAGDAAGDGGFAQVELLSGGPLWVDALQMEQPVPLLPTVPSDTTGDLLKASEDPGPELAPDLEADVEQKDEPQPYTPSLADISLGIAPDGGPQAGVASLASPAMSEPSEPLLLELDGTEFDFYTTEDEARARCFVRVPADRCGSYALRWWIERDGKKARVASPDHPLPGINAWAFALTDMPEGRYTLRARLCEGDTTVEEKSKPFRKLPPAEHEVRINQWGRFLVCDGEPFLWYGFYCSLSGDESETAAILKDIKGVNATAVLNYSGYEPNITVALDQAHTLGLKMWVHLQRMATWPSPKNRTGYTAETAKAAATELILKHRNHPALLGWCTVDEPGNRAAIFTKEHMEEWYRLVKSLDPYHPCISSHMNHEGDAQTYGGAVDLALIPFTERDRHSGLFSAFREAGFPVACNPPCYDAGVVRHAPTAAVQRMRTYKALVMGACGISTYTYRCTTMDTWGAFRRIGEEMRTLAPILLTPDERLTVEAEPKGRVFARLKRHGAKTYLIAVNPTPGPADAVFRMVDLPGMRTVKPLFGSPPSDLAAGGTVLRVPMPGRSCAVYVMAE